MRNGRGRDSGKPLIVRDRRSEVKGKGQRETGLEIFHFSFDIFHLPLAQEFSPWPVQKGTCAPAATGTRPLSKRCSAVVTSFVIGLQERSVPAMANEKCQMRNGKSPTLLPFALCPLPFALCPLTSALRLAYTTTRACFVVSAQHIPKTLAEFVRILCRHDRCSEERARSKIGKKVSEKL